MPIVASSSAQASELNLGGKFRAPSDDSDHNRRPSRVVVGNGMDIYSFFDEQTKELTDRDRFMTYPSRKLMYVVVAQFFIAPAIVISQGVLAITTITFILETAVALGGAGVFLISGLVAYRSHERPTRWRILLSILFGFGAIAYAVGVIVLTVQLIERNFTADLTFNCILIFLCLLEMIITIIQIHAGLKFVCSCNFSM